jgi:hypothetical protein
MVSTSAHLPLEVLGATLPVLPARALQTQLQLLDTTIREDFGGDTREVLRKYPR